MRSRAVVPLSVLVCVLLAASVAAAPIAQTRLSPGAVDFTPLVDAESFTLTVSMPGGKVVRHQFAGGEAIGFSLSDGSFPDGVYNWELTASPRLRGGDRAKLDAARGKGDDAVADAQRAAGIAAGGWVQSGTFRVADGAVVDASPAEPGGKHRLADQLRNTVAVDQVIPDDLIVQGSECVGLDCVNNENFGFDTIRLKENNLRIHFDDTSTTSGFPANDWRLIANDSASGGSSKFSIEDSTSAKTPFTITAGASTNSIFADSTGRIGFRTSTPVLDLHVATSNTPAIRLEQNNSGGFTAQTWDIGANEANFFVRDVTGGSKLSLRIRPGAPTSSIDISADGDVGVGTASPSASLHVSRSNETAKLQVSETSGTTALRNLMTLSNNGGVQFLLDRTDASANDWQVSNFNTTFAISIPGSATNQMVLTNTGNMTISGTTYNTGSSREIKENFAPVDGVDILERLAALPMTSWTAKEDPSQRHIGPIAEEWWAAFGLGPDDKHVSLTDVGGVALSAIKGLHEVVGQKEATIAALESDVASLRQENRELAARLAAIEKLLASQSE